MDRLTTTSAPWNNLKNINRVFTPADTAVQTPNSETPYSWAGLDLRAEPIVISLPEIAKERYYNVEMWDAYSYIIGYSGSRTTGNDAGNIMLAGPDWKGETPEGIKKVYTSDTDFGVVVIRSNCSILTISAMLRRSRQSTRCNLCPRSLEQLHHRLPRQWISSSLSPRPT